MKSKDVEDSIKMNFESAALLKILMEQSAVIAEKINKDFKRIKLKCIIYMMLEQFWC